MQALKARVRHGRLVLDEPTDLPEGQEVELVILGADLAPDERARLLQAIDEGAEDFAHGNYVDGIEFARGLLAKRHSANR